MVGQVSFSPSLISSPMAKTEARRNVARDPLPLLDTKRVKIPFGAQGSSCERQARGHGWGWPEPQRGAVGRGSRGQAGCSHSFLWGILSNQTGNCSSLATG